MRRKYEDKERRKYSRRIKTERNGMKSRESKERIKKETLERGGRWRV